MALDFNGLYEQMLGRKADSAGLEWWNQQAAAGADPTALQNDFLRSANQELMNRTQPVAQAQSMAPTMQGYQKSPYLDAIAKDITQQSTQNLQEQVLPGLRYGAMAAGGFGSSRQGLAEAQAVERSQRSLDGSLAQLYGNDYQQDRARALQQYQADQGYSLGMGNLALANQNSQGQLALGNKQADNSFGLGLGQLGLSSQQGNLSAYTQNRALDLQQMGVGSNLWNTGTANYLSQGAGLQNLGSTQQTAAWDPANNFSNLLARYSGLNGSTNSTSSQGVSPVSGAMGGALFGAQAANIWSNSGTNSALNYANGVTAGGGDGLGAFINQRGWSNGTS